MKRLIWLLLAAFCTALAQVQPVELPAPASTRCPCCAKPGDCGLPDCGVPAGATVVRLVAEQPARTTQTAIGRKAVRPLRLEVVSQIRINASATATYRRSQVELTASPAPIPLYEAHCSFLI
jgi:hypothetical protein